VRDGDQVLGEVQAPAATGAAAFTMESDLTRPTANTSSLVQPVP
jgi:hypothetical protein